MAAVCDLLYVPEDNPLNWCSGCILLYFEKYIHINSIKLCYNVFRFLFTNSDDDTERKIWGICKKKCFKTVHFDHDQCNKCSVNPCQTELSCWRSEKIKYKFVMPITNLIQVVFAICLSPDSYVHKSRTIVLWKHTAARENLGKQRENSTSCHIILDYLSIFSGGVPHLGKQCFLFFSLRTNILPSHPAHCTSSL